jgi:hypothetical protein
MEGKKEGEGKHIQIQTKRRERRKTQIKDGRKEGITEERKEGGKEGTHQFKIALTFNTPPSTSISTLSSFATDKNKRV